MYKNDLFKVARKRSEQHSQMLLWLPKLQLSICPSLYMVYFGIQNASKSGSCLRLIERYLEQRQSILLQLPFCRTWRGSQISVVSYLDCVWSHRRTCLTCFMGLEQCLYLVLIPLLSTLDRFLSPYMYVLICSGQIWSLSFESYVSTSFYPLLLAEMAVESFHCHKYVQCVQFTLRILRLLRHIQVCSHAILWRLKLRRPAALISLFSTSSKSVF